MIAYNHYIVDQVAHSHDQVNHQGTFCEMCKTCCYSDSIALKYDRPNVKID